MNERTPATESDDEESLRDLLREAGARAAPPASVVDDVRLAVFNEWQQVVLQRRRTRFLRYGLAAGIAIAVVAVLAAVQSTRLREPVATVTRVEGTLQMTADGGEDWQSVLPGASLPSGVVLRTDDSARVALNLRGLSVRIDSGSLVELKRGDRIILERGALYVDTGAAPQLIASQSLIVDTMYGSVRHDGTQYSLRILADGLAVSVREGRVQIDHGGGAYTGSAGEYIVVPRDGAVQRREISSQNAEWQWATDIAPVFLIDHRPLSQFLDWVARETGKPVTYASPEVRARAEKLILRGSVGNLPPEQALAAVLATTPFTQQQAQDSIRIEL